MFRTDGFSTEQIDSSFSRWRLLFSNRMRFPTIDWTSVPSKPSLRLIGYLGHCKKTGVSTGRANGMIEQREQTVNLFWCRNIGVGDSGALLVSTVCVIQMTTTNMRAKRTEPSTA